MTSSYNPTLTNYAAGLSQDTKTSTADFLAPVVPVIATGGRFKKYDDKNAFQTYDTSRALGGPAKRIVFTGTDGSYNCAPQALEIGIDDAEFDAAGEGNMGRLEENRTRTLVLSARLSHEDKVMTAAKTLAAVGSRGVWSNPTNDPVAEIDEQIESIATATGMMPNKLLFGLGAWRVTRNNGKVVNRMPSNAAVGVTLQQFATMLMNPNMEIRVGILAKDTAKIGAAKNTTNMIGSEVFLFYGSDTPDEYDPSFMKTFYGGSYGIDAVRTYRDESARSKVIAVDWAEDVQVISSICGRRLTIS
jgi:hypothetical protein